MITWPGSGRSVNEHLLCISTSVREVQCATPDSIGAPKHFLIALSSVCAKDWERGRKHFRKGPTKYWQIKAELTSENTYEFACTEAGKCVWAGRFGQWEVREGEVYSETEMKWCTEKWVWPVTWGPSQVPCKSGYKHLLQP